MNRAKAWIDEMNRQSSARLEALSKLVVFDGTSGVQPGVFGSVSQQQRGMAAYQAAVRLSA